MHAVWVTTMFAFPVVCVSFAILSWQDLSLEKSYPHTGSHQVYFSSRGNVIWVLCLRICMFPHSLLSHYSLRKGCEVDCVNLRFHHRFLCASVSSSTMNIILSTRRKLGIYWIERGRLWVFTYPYTYYMIKARILQSMYLVWRDWYLHTPSDRRLRY